MPVTPSRGYPFPVRGDIPAGSDQIEDLAMAVDADVAAAYALIASHVATLNTTIGALPLGVIKRGNRTSDKAGIAAEAGILRVDSIPTVSGRRYAALTTAARFDSATGTDICVPKLRMSEVGAATTASTQIASGENTDQRSLTLLGFWTSTVTASTTSVIYTGTRAIGVGATSWLAEGRFDLEILDLGVAPSDTGVDI